MAGESSPSFLKRLPDLPYLSVLLGNSAYADGDLDNARRHFKQSIELTFRRIKTDPDNPVWQRHLSDGYNMLGVIASDQAKYSEAEQWHNLNLSIIRKQCASNPGNPDFKFNLAKCHYRIGDVRVLNNKPGNAIPPCSEGLAIFEGLAVTNPEYPGILDGVGFGKERLGSLAFAFGRLIECQRLYQEVLLIRKKLHAIDPGNPKTQSDLASACHLNADVAAKLQEWKRAIEYCSHAVVLWHAVAEKDPAAKRPQNQLMKCYVLLGDITALQEDPKQAEKSYLMALPIIKKITDASSNDPAKHRELFGLYLRLAHISDKLDNKPNSTKYRELSREQLRRMQDKGITLSQQELGFLKQ